MQFGGSGLAQSGGVLNPFGTNKITGISIREISVIRGHFVFFFPVFLLESCHQSQKAGKNCGVCPLTFQKIFVNLVSMQVNKAEAGNREISLKAFLVQRLRENPGVFFSGQSLAAEPGVSRTAVWKAVRTLEASGYPIEGNDKGYAWKGGDGDFLYPWEFGKHERFFHHWVSTDSTMNRAGELAARGCPGGSVASAEEQTAGRGRNGRKWDSGKGGLFFTLLERLSLTASEYYRAAMAAQIASAKALARVCGKPCLLRWPNDVYGAGRKLAGILTEFRAEGDRLTWISIGIGVNVNNRTRERTAVSCAELSGRVLSRREVLLAILEEWDRLKRAGFQNLEKRWNAASDSLGRKAETRGGGTGGEGSSPARGVFLGADPLGRGMIRTDRGEILKFWPGAVSFTIKN
jgi:BirA family biotin operon repressor/biotin-[acetyl-CoA-carboxylase] ligase